MARPALGGFVSAVLTLAVITTATGAWAARPPATWDDLVAAKARRFELVYLLPGADFRAYSKVMLDPTEVAFAKNWMRDYNNSTRTRRVSDEDAQRAMTAVSTGFRDIFAKTFQQAGYPVVEAPGQDVLRLRTAIINLVIAAPDVQTAGRSRVYSSEAGQATMVIEVRDSMTGAILGRAVDRKMVGDTMPYLRNSVTNRSDFTRVFDRWAKEAVEGLNELKTASRAETPTAGAGAGGGNK